jgi:hypothetical protein
MRPFRFTFRPLGDLSFSRWIFRANDGTYFNEFAVE